VQIMVSLKLPAKVEKKKAYYVSSCPPLDVHSQGETKKKALKNLVEALELFIFSCFERGTLIPALSECGFKYTPGRRAKARSLPPNYQTVDISLPIEVPQRINPSLWHD